jgi:hypothetical protein
MNRITLPLTILSLAVLACGVQAAIQPPLTDEPNPPNQSHTAAPGVILTPTDSPSFTPAPVLGVNGCWNIRSSPAVDDNIRRVQCGGVVTVYGWAANGFIIVGEGEFMCARAVGEEVKCQ